jgi:hypothetical protein
MGTPPAPMYTTLYFANHKSKLIHHFPQLRFYRCYIDDGFGIWTGDDDIHWKEFQLAFVSFGKLSGTFSTLSKWIDLLDNTLEIDATGSIDTTLFEMALNLYLYLPPHSALQATFFWLQDLCKVPPHEVSNESVVIPFAGLATISVSIPTAVPFC